MNNTMTKMTAEVIDRFNRAFVQHDLSALDNLIADDCVMEAIQPAPNGGRTEGRDACLAFWQARSWQTARPNSSPKRSLSLASERRSAGATLSAMVLPALCVG